MARIVILGANSYIARNFIVKLKERDEKNILLYDYQEEHLDGMDHYRKAYLTDLESLKNIDFSCDLIYLFAGLTGTANGFDIYKDFIEVNELGLLNILKEYCNQKSTAKIIFPSTRLVYKGQKGKLSEDSEKEFKTLYAMTKFACENYLAMYHKIFGINYVILRLCIPYGTLLPNASSYGTAEFFASKGRKGEDIPIYGDGNQRRTLIHVEDLCEILLQVGFNDSCVNNVYNVGGDTEFSVFEIAKVFADIYGVAVVPVEWPEMALKLESGDTVFDSTKLDSLLKSSYRHNFKQWAIDNKESLKRIGSKNGK